MKRRLFLLCLLLVSVCVHAQLSRGELLSKLVLANTDSLKIAAYNDLITYYSTANPDSVNYFVKEGLQYATDKKYPIGEARIMVTLGLMDKDQGRMELAKKRVTHALEIFRKENDLHGVARMTNSLGALEAIRGNTKVAVKNFLEALKLHEQLHDIEGQMIAYRNLGSFYLGNDDTTNATKYLMLGEKVSRKMPVNSEILSLYNTIGVLEILKGNRAKGLKIFLSNLELSAEPKFVKARIECLSYLGQFYLEQGEPAKALQFLQDGLKMAEEKNLRELESNILLEMALIAKATDVALSLSYLNRAKEIAEQMNNKAFLVNVYDDVAAICKERGNYKEAYEAKEKKQRIVDSMYTLNKAMEIASITSEYEFQESNMRLSQMEELSNRNAKERNIFVCIAVFIFFILLVSLFYYRKSRMLNKQLLQRKEELKDLNAMKDKLFSVIGHDLRGPIATVPAVLDIYDDVNTGPEEKRYILDSLKEHSKVSLETLDKLLYWGHSLVKGIRISKANFYTKGHIKEALEFKKMAAAEKNITVTDNTSDDIHVFADPAHFDFIIRNLLANGIKYTRQNGSIQISADKSGQKGFTVFAVKDNGVGISKELLTKLFTPVDSTAGTANEKGNGIGLMLCKEFAIRNGGDIWVQSELGVGTTFYYSIPNAA